MTVVHQVNEDGRSDFPMEVWRIILLFLTMVEDWKNIRLVCRAFLTEMDAQLVCRWVKILQTPAVDGYGIVIRPSYTPEMLVLQLWRFVLAGNFDALLLLAWVTVYHVGDLEAGMGLLHKGAKRGDARSMYELGLLFIRGPTVLHWQIGYGWINRAMACRHALSRLMKFPVDDVMWLKAEAELSEAHCLMPMFKARVDDVSDCMKYQRCGNPLCVRLVSQDVVRDCKRLWYWEARRGFGAGWWGV